MDPLSVTASLIAIVQVSGAVISTCHELYRDVKDAANNVSRVVEEVESIKTIAQGLIKIAYEDRALDLPSLQTMSQPSGTLSRCFDELVDLKAILKPSKLGAFKWPLIKSDIEDRLRVLGRFKATLQLGLAADSAHGIARILGYTRFLPLVHHQLNNISRSMEEVAEDQSRKQLIRWLSTTDQSSKHENELRKSAAGTGNWLIEHEIYTTWKENPALLWLKGNAGSGKTVLCARVIQDITGLCDKYQTTGLCYFYLDGSVQETLTLDTIYRNLIAQLVAIKSRLPISLKRLDTTSSRELYKLRPKTTLQWEELFKEMLGDFGRCFVIIDGLDECEEFIPLESLLEAIARLVNKTHNNIHFLVASRDLERIRYSFQDLKAACISINGEALDLDLRTTLSLELSANAKFARWPLSLKKSIKTSLLAQAYGSFRWLDCQLQELRKCSTQAAVRRLLNTLPGSLEVYYTRVLDKLNAENRDLVLNLLRWVIFALRPLSLKEIASAISINVSGNPPFVDENLELLDPEHFLDGCSSLVSTYVSADNAKDRQIYVRLAHFSVREFLLSDAIRNGAYKAFALEKELANSYLASSCQAYFHEAVRSATNDVWTEYPLASYAGHFWLKHEQLAGDKRTFSMSNSMLIDMFDETKPYFRKWRQVADIDRPWLDEGSEKPIEYSPLYCAAFHGLTEAVKSILSNGGNPNRSSEALYGTALQAAALNGCTEIVKVLIGMNADVNASGGIFNSAIAAASANGHEGVVRKLLMAGANPNGQKKWDDGRSDPLFNAAYYGHLGVCRLLLEHGAQDSFRRKKRPGSALHAAATRGRLDIVKELLLHKQIIESNEYGMSYIAWSAVGESSAGQSDAVAHGRVDILRELSGYGLEKEDILRSATRAGNASLVLETLSQGDNIEGPGESSDHSYALVSAARGNHVSIVKELLARGYDPTGEANYKSPLSAAIAVGSLEIVQMLIDAGADPTQARHPLQLLSAAIRERHRDIAKVLIRYGIDTHGALHRAALDRDWRGFQILLDLGADALRVDGDDKASLMQAAARAGSVEIIGILLQKGLSCDMTCGAATTPLMEAIRSRTWDVARFLLDAGAAVNATPPLSAKPPAGSGSIIAGMIWPPQPAYENALTMAIRERNPGFAQLLIEIGAEVHSAEVRTAGTPLLYAVWWEYTGLVEELLERGAEPNQKGTVLERNVPTLPLHLATEKANMEIIDRLISSGARVNEQDDSGFTALHIAAAGDSPDALKALIYEHHADITLQLQNGSQPVHSAASRGLVASLKILLDAGAAIDSKNKHGRTPLHWAAEAGNWDTVELLLDRGADATLKSDDEGLNTALEMAYAARKMPFWNKINRVEECWDDERTDGLLKKLKEKAKNTR